MAPGAHVHFTVSPIPTVTPAGLKLFPPLPTATFTVTGCRPVAVDTRGEPASGAFAVSGWVPAVGARGRVVVGTRFGPVVVVVGVTAPAPAPTAQKSAASATPWPRASGA